MSFNPLQPAPRKIHLAVLLLFFLGISIYGSLVPFHYVPLPLDQALSKFTKIPFLELGVDSRADWVANLLLFIPLGFFGAGVLRLDGAPGWFRSGLSGLVVVPLCCAASVSLEFSQLWFPNRTVSQNDIFAETLGSLTGVLGWMILGQPMTNWVRSLTRQVEPGQRWDGVLMLVAVFHLISSALPLDLTIHPREIWHKYQDGKVIFLPFSKLDVNNREATFELLFLIFKSALIGWLFARLWQRRWRQRPSAGWLVAAALVFSTLVELMQLLVFSRTCDVDGVLFGALGFVAGGWFLPVGEASAAPVTPPRRALLALPVCLYLPALCWFFWYPFRFDFSLDRLAGRARHFLQVPFAALYAGSDYHAMEEIIRKNMLFALLALLVAIAIKISGATAAARSRRLAVTLGFCWLVGLLIEGVQIALPDHLADITDVLLYAMGGCWGTMLAAYLFPACTQSATTRNYHSDPASAPAPTV